MRTIGHFLTASLLMLVLTITAFAGDMQTPGFTSPPPAQPQTPTTGDIQDPSALIEGQMDTPLLSDSVAEAALTLTLNALSAF